MSNTQESKQEASIPTAARVNLISLAELAKWWEESGHRLKSMSQLIAWSIDLLRDILRSNGKIDETDISLADANRYLNEKGLYQLGVRSRSFKKEATAIRFESMREEGIDPKEYVPGQYNVLHNKNSIEPSTVKVRKNNFSEVNWIPLEEYPEYLYPEGDEVAKEKLIRQLAEKRVKSVSEMRDEQLRVGMESELVVKE